MKCLGFQMSVKNIILCLKSMYTAWTRHVLSIMGQKLNSYSQGTYAVVYEVNNCLCENHLLYFNVYVPTSAGHAGRNEGHTGNWEAWSFQHLDGET